MNHSSTAYEYFLDKGELVFMHNREVMPFADLPVSEANGLRRELDRTPGAETVLLRAGIHDPMAQLEQFATCRYGRLNDIADRVNGRPNDHEAPTLDCVQHCRFACRLCANEAPGGKLTPREVELEHLVINNSNKEIAQVLHLSVNTVITEVASLMSKAMAKTRSGISVWRLHNNIF